MLLQNRSVADFKWSQHVAHANKYFGLLLTRGLEVRVVTEENAVDSYQNLLFSLLQFYSILNKWPAHITLVSHDFKRKRFIELHCPAIRWPLERFTYVGIDPPEEVVSRLDLELGEFNKGYGSFKRDPYGVRTYLKDKRESRGWSSERLLKIFHSGIPEEVKPLLVWDGGEADNGVFYEDLPWDPAGYEAPSKGTPVHTPVQTPVHSAYHSRASSPKKA